MNDVNLSATDELSFHYIAKHPPAWWGVWALVATEASLFGYLLFSYFYLAFQTEAAWPPGGPPDLFLSGANTGFLISSSACVWISEKILEKGKQGWSALFLLAGVALGALFVFIQVVFEWGHKTYGPSSHLYGSLYFTITGFHVAHVVIGVAALSMVLGMVVLGRFGAERRSALSIVGIYWHFVDVVWLFIFSILYVLPHIAGGLP